MKKRNKFFSLFTHRYNDGKMYVIVHLFFLKFHLYRLKDLENTIIQNPKELDGATANALISLLQDRQIEKNIKNPILHVDEYKQYISKKIASITESPYYLKIDSSHNYLNILLGLDTFKFKPTFDIYETTANKFLAWELRSAKWNLDILVHAQSMNREVLHMGDAFLRSFTSFVDKTAAPEHRKGISFTIDDLTCFFDATRQSRLEQMLDDKNLQITEQQLQRARCCIHTIIDNHLSKYNHQPIYTPNIGREGVKKILVIDQAYGDMSISKGLANGRTFDTMLEAAIAENPDADIIIKTHPDTIAGKKGYYTNIEECDNIYKQTEAINPISLIQYVDKVYVCTSQFGFEALMCKKEVHVFGMPFYAGWGLTHDRQVCERRSNRRTLEEVFYLAYITYSWYVNPKTNSICEIEESMDYLIKARIQS